MDIEFIKTCTDLDLVFLRNDLKKHPEDKDFLAVVDSELKVRAIKNAQRNKEPKVEPTMVNGELQHKEFRAEEENA